MSSKVFANAYFRPRKTLQSGNASIDLKTSFAQSSQTRRSEVDRVLNPICEVRVDEVIDKRKTHRGVAIAILVYHKESHYSCDVFLDEFPAGFLPNILMGEEISAIKFSGTWNGKKVLRFRALAWTYQTDQLKAKIFGLMLNAIGSDIEGIEWRGGESLAVGDGNELAQRLDELLKKDVPDIEPEDEFDF